MGKMSVENKRVTNRTTIVKSELGMHARPAAKIAQIAGKATSDVWLRVDDSKVDATSIIDILTLGAVKGTQLTIEIDNETDIGILEQILIFFEDGFGEE